MQKIIVSDTSCLILLDKFREMSVLNKLFGNIIITPEIAKEFNKATPDWILIKTPSNSIYQNILEASIDTGEASAIALALEQENCLLIIDDNKGRKFAKQMGLTITGTIGLLIEAKNKGHINSLKTLFEKINETNFRISEKLISYALGKVGE